MKDPELYEQAEELLGEFLCPGMYPVICSSGSMALYLALAALQQTTLSRRKLVAIPDLSMIAIPRAVAMAGMEVKTIECGYDLNLDPYRLNYANSFFGIICVHTYGRLCDMEAVDRVFRPQTHCVIEDLAEAHGVKPHHATNAACFSFYRNKIIAGEEGGLVAFRSKNAADRAKLLRSHGFTDKHDFQHIPGGVNARCSNAHAKLIIDSLNRYVENVKRRWEIIAQYADLLPQFKRPRGEQVAPWVYDIDLREFNFPVDTVVEKLRERGVQARHCFKPVSQQAEFFEASVRESERRFNGGWQRIFYLPVDPSMRDEDVKKAATSLLEITAK